MLENGRRAWLCERRLGRGDNLRLDSESPPRMEKFVVNADLRDAEFLLHRRTRNSSSLLRAGACEPPLERLAAAASASASCRPFRRDCAAVRP